MFLNGCVCVCVCVCGSEKVYECIKVPGLDIKPRHVLVLGTNRSSLIGHRVKVTLLCGGDIFGGVNIFFSKAISSQF